MLITKIKERDTLQKHLEERPLVVKCFGCREVLFPEKEIDAWLAEHQGEVAGVLRLDYLCREEFSRVYRKELVSPRDVDRPVLVFSCGVGVQVVAKLREESRVVPGCDTGYLNGFQGLSALEDDCLQCGECWLNHTGGICPLTACSKGLLNGPCGGANDGKCEVSSEMECGWELIYQRLKETGQEGFLHKTEVLKRDYRKIITAKPVLLPPPDAEKG